MPLKLEVLIKKYNDGLCTDEERAWLEQWYQSFELNKGQAANDTEKMLAIKEDAWQQILLKKKESDDETAKKAPNGQLFSFKHWTRYAAVFVSLLLLTFAVVKLSEKNNQQTAVISNAPADKATDIFPGTSKAYLVLADGKTVSLDSANQLQLKEKDGTLINKDAGKLVYNNGGNVSANVLYNTLATPRGGEYQLELPDGTKVWLNAASSIKFPTQFTGVERTVFLTGEAYFEVAANKKMPFIVKLENDVSVKVLGTHFNVMGYDDEDVVRTTLVEGSVVVSANKDEVKLSPEKQAVFQKNNHKLNVRNADVQKATAWKNGMTEFDGDNLVSIMKQLGRWYDIEVSFAGPVSSEVYNGAIRRKAPLSKVLEILKAAGVEYKIEGGKKLIITGG